MLYYTRTVKHNVRRPKTQSVRDDQNPPHDNNSNKDHKKYIPFLLPFQQSQKDMTI